MKKICATLLTTLGLCIMASSLQADISPNPNRGNPRFDRPEPNPRRPGTPLDVQIDFNSDQSVLIVPEHCINAKGDGRESSWINTPRTIFAGLAMSLAVGAVVFLRRSHKIGPGAAAIAFVGVLSLGAAGVTWANLAPPHEPPQIPNLTVGEIPVQVKVVPKGEKIQLILTEADMDKLTGDDEPAVPLPPSNLPGEGSKPRPTKSAPPSSAPPKL